jgi:uncharacterized protein (DUF2141 family)
VEIARIVIPYMRLIRSLFLIITIFLPPLVLPADEPGRVEVVVKGIREPAGSILVALYKGPEGFPEDREAAYGNASVRLAGAGSSPDTVTVTFAGLPPGLYAAAAIHDRNGNEILDRGLFGVPREAYAVSNNVRGFGRPGFRDAAFRVGPGESRIELDLVHLYY